MSHEELEEARANRAGKDKATAENVGGKHVRKLNTSAQEGEEEAIVAESGVSSSTPEYNAARGNAQEYVPWTAPAGQDLSCTPKTKLLCQLTNLRHNQIPHKLILTRLFNLNSFLQSQPTLLSTT